MNPRGIRNNNPGNIRYNGIAWQGLAVPPSDGAFCRFVSTKYGIRALSIIIKTYKKKYNLNTIKQIISRWAPTNENDTNSYVMDVSKALKVAPTDNIDVFDNFVMLNLCRAIIRHENGIQPYTDDLIMNGIEML